MRPINRGIRPQQEDGSLIEFTAYQLARPELINRLGEYCSYCEMQLDASLAVEHVQPKSLNAELELEWDNFLLACTNCNSTKGDKEIELNQYYWPDRDNTFRAFKYCEGGVIMSADDLDEEQQQIAENTLHLVGLDKDSLNNPTASDRRLLNRREAWDIAQRALERLARNNSHIDFCDQIIDHAKDKGYWSIWMTVFSNDVYMRNRLINAFPGTLGNCFDVHTNTIPRMGGNL